MLPDWQPTTRLLARIGNASDVASAAAGRQDVLCWNPLFQGQRFEGRAEYERWMAKKTKGTK